MRKIQGKVWLAGRQEANTDPASFFRVGYAIAKCFVAEVTLVADVPIVVWLCKCWPPLRQKRYVWKRRESVMDDIVGC